MIFSLYTLLDSFMALFPRVTEDTVRKQLRWQVQYRSVAALTGTNALAEEPIGFAKQKGRLVSLRLIPLAAVTANASNYGSVILRKRTVATPGTGVVLATFASDTVTTDDLVAFAARDLANYLTATAADLDVGEGDSFTVEVTKAGSGVTIPIFGLTLLLEGRD